MDCKKWKFQQVDGSAVQELADELGLPESIARVLVQRGLGDSRACMQYMNPRLAGLSDPYLLPDMDKAVGRIWEAIDRAERITVFGDYDVDGVTSAALMIRVLQALGAIVSGFVPDRLDEGYGLSQEALDRCMEEQQPKLLLSVDCGTNSLASITRAQTGGVDIIVTDHHEPGEHVAPAFALINPKLGRSGDHLSGVGVAFKLAHALVKAGRDEGRACAEQIDLRGYLDLVALGTVADIVPLVGENRIIVRHGLLQMQETQWVGMAALKDVAAIRGELNTGHLGFQLGPRINAAGRIGEPMQALNLLTTDDPAEARRIASLLNRNNQERRSIERKMADDAFAEIDRYYDPGKHFGLVVARVGWHPGVVGIVASRVSRHYNRPAIIMGVDDDGVARGSCRSIEEFDLLAGLDACSAHLGKFGGHRMAAGLEVRAGELEAFRTAFNHAAGEVLKGMDLLPVQHVDAVVDPGTLDQEFYRVLNQLRPFGQDNPEPVWALLGVGVSGMPRVVGERHLKLKLSAGGSLFDAIAFNYPLDALPEGRLDVAFILQENRWNGQTTLQLQIRSIRPAR